MFPASPVLVAWLADPVNTNPPELTRQAFNALGEGMDWPAARR